MRQTSNAKKESFDLPKTKVINNAKKPDGKKQKFEIGVQKIAFSLKHDNIETS